MNTFLRKTLSILFGCLALITLAACSESEEVDTEYDNWQTRNEEYFEQQYQRAADSVAANPSRWMFIKGYSKDATTEGEHTDYIIVHVLSQSEEHSEALGESDLECPIYTDSVRVHYRGNLMPSDSYSVTSESFGTKGYQFDSSWIGDYDTSTAIPSKFAVKALVNGFCTAIQRMHIGDRWEIMMPYQLGYNAASATGIPSYSTLIFDITLYSITHAGYLVPDFQ